MQQITYVPPGDSYGGSDNVILKLAPPYILGSVDGTGGVDVDITSSAIPGFDGELVQAVRAEGRLITVSLHVEGKSRADMYAWRAELVRQLTPSDKTGLLYYRNDHLHVRIAAIPQGAPKFTGRIKNYNTANIQFYCPRPHWEAVESVSVPVAYIGSGFKFPLRLHHMRFGIIQNVQEVVNENRLPVPIEITITAPATSPIVFSNETTGEYIELGKALTDGESLIINTRRGDISVTLRHADGSIKDAFQYLEPDSDFFQLQPGVNTLKYSTWNESEQTTATITYRPLYSGV